MIDVDPPAYELEDPEGGEIIGLWIVDTFQGHPQIKVKYGRGGSRSTVNYRTRYERRHAAVNALLGDCQFVDLAPAQYGYLSRRLPHRLPEATRRGDALWCVDAEAGPEITLTPVDETGVNARWALVNTVYETLPFKLREDTDPLVQTDGGVNPDESGGPGGLYLPRYVRRVPPKDKNRVLTTKGGTWFWEGTTVPGGLGMRSAKEANFIPQTDCELVYKWMDVPQENIPFQAILQTMNCTNAEAFDVRWPAGYLIFRSYSFDEKTLPGDRPGADLVYTFDFKRNGANRFPDSKRGWAFHLLVAGDLAGRPYPQANFYKLFRPTALGIIDPIP